MLWRQVLAQSILDGDFSVRNPSRLVHLPKRIGSAAEGDTPHFRTEARDNIGRRAKYAW